jgi:hypothetical protein
MNRLGEQAMNKLLGTALAATTLSLASHAAFASDDVRESRPVDAKVTKVKLGGVIGVVVRQGATPSLVISGDKAGVARVTTRQHGDTLEISTEDRSGMHFGWNNEKMRAELTVPNLEEFVSLGVGSSTVTGFAGDHVKVSLEGAGSLTMDGRYRNVDARLGGVGSFTLEDKDADRIDLRMGGAGRMTIIGQAKVLNGHMSGVGSLDAAKLRADAVELDMSGMGSANVFAQTSVNLSLSGLGSASVYGNPASRNARTSGLGKVSWK